MSGKKGKKGQSVLLIPGAEGWEVWTGAGETVSLSLRSDTVHALEVSPLPAGELKMAFPLREVSSLPMMAPTTDKTLFADMADMHVERLAMRPAIESGNLSDCFSVAERGEATLLLPVVLAPPPEGSLPSRSPKAFDVSARCYPMPADAVAVWKELGRWVFALGINGNPMHFQALASVDLDEAAGREIRMSLMQLQIQGLLDSVPTHCFVWVGEQDASPGHSAITALGKGFGGRASMATKPTPSFPSKPSELLPADTRAERLAKRKRQQAALMVSALVLAYLGVVGWLGWKLVEAEKRAAAAQSILDEIGGGAEFISEHQKKWEQLDPVIGLEHWPVELLSRCAKAIPSGGQLRFERAEFNNQLEIDDDGTTKKIRRITLTGKAETLEQVNQLNLNLKRSGDLAYYDWNTPPPQETNDGRWAFNYDASPKDPQN